MKGPVPMALRVAKFSWPEVRSMERVALFASAQRLDIIAQVVSCSRKMGSGWFVSNSTVKSSTFRTSFTEARTEVRFDPCARTRSAEKITSSAVKGVPSEKRTFRRRLNRHTVGEG